MTWTVFLDRDGTLILNRNYPTRPSQLVPYPSARRGLMSLHRAGAQLVVVSNQSAVARGLLDQAGLVSMDAKLRKLFSAVPFAGTYYCPHHPDYSGPCDCRKPQTGLILKGLGQTGSSPQSSFLIGDSAADMKAGRRAGLTTVLVLTGFGRRDRSQVLDKGWADTVTRDVGTAAAWILRRKHP